MIYEVNNTKTIAVTLAAIGAFSATSATAQSLPDNMYVDGYIELSSLHGTGIDEVFWGGQP